MWHQSYFCIGMQCTHLVMIMSQTVCGIQVAPDSKLSVGTRWPCGQTTSELSNGIASSPQKNCVSHFREMRWNLELGTDPESTSYQAFSSSCFVASSSMSHFLRHKSRSRWINWINHYHIMYHTILSTMKLRHLLIEQNIGLTLQDHFNGDGYNSAVIS
jgi:hypothetical protein